MQSPRVSSFRPAATTTQTEASPVNEEIFEEDVDFDDEPQFIDFHSYIKSYTDNLLKHHHWDKDRISRQLHEFGKETALVLRHYLDKGTVVALKIASKELSERANHLETILKDPREKVLMSDPVLLKNAKIGNPNIPDREVSLQFGLEIPSLTMSRSTAELIKEVFRNFPHTEFEFEDHTFADRSIKWVQSIKNIEIKKDLRPAFRLDPKTDQERKLVQQIASDLFKGLENIMKAENDLDTAKRTNTFAQQQKAELRKKIEVLQESIRVEAERTKLKHQQNNEEIARLEKEIEKLVAKQEQLKLQELEGRKKTRAEQRELRSQLQQIRITQIRLEFEIAESRMMLQAMQSQLQNSDSGSNCTIS